MAAPSTPVSREVWPRGGRRAAGPDLRRAALVQAAALGVVGALVRFGMGHATFGLVLWALGAVALLLGLLAPAAFAPLHRLGQALGRAVGAALTWLLLTPLYLLGFGLAALVLRLRGADPLQRRPLPTGFSYWIRRRRASAPEDYAKQYRVEDLGARAERRPLDEGPGGAA